MLRTDRQGSTQILTLDRPDKSNALHPTLISRLAECLNRTENLRDIRVVVLTGSGTSFCAGLDLKHLATIGEEEKIEYMKSAFDLFRQVYHLRQPVIAAVNGPAIAGGFDLAAFCDIRVCSSRARFAQTEILLGLTQIMYPIYKVIGLGHAKELALTGRMISAEDAYRVGLVTGVYSEDELLPHALKLAEQMGERPSDALVATKRLSRELIDMDTDTAITRMFDVISARLRSSEHKTSLEAYLRHLRTHSRDQ